MVEPKYKRVVLKLSGEAMAGQSGFGIDPATIKEMVKEIKEVHALGVEIAIIVGGGNIWRGITGAEMGMERAQADYMGMLATVMNSLALQDVLENNGVPTRVQSICGRLRNHLSVVVLSATWKRAAWLSLLQVPGTLTSQLIP